MQFFYLYVLIDVFSRYVVGWLVAGAENVGLAVALIEESCDKRGVERDSPILHSDRGNPMRATTTAELLVDLGVAASFSRPRVSNDSSFSEAHFKTLKYRPPFSACFEGLDHPRAHSRKFFPWYNNEHHHSCIGFMTSAAMHFGTAPRARAAARCRPAGGLPRASGALQGQAPDAAESAYRHRHQLAETPPRSPLMI